MSEVNEGVQIILNRMESNPEEFFGDVGKWRWIFSENLREVMTEPEKAAIHTAMTKVRRLELTAKAVASVMPSDEEDEEEEEGPLKRAWLKPQVDAPKKTMTMTRSEWEVFKAKNRTSN